MVKFSFSVAPKKSNRKSISNNIIIEKSNVRGVIFIDIDSICYVKYEGYKYIIKNTCYSCKNKERVFRLGCDTPKKICCDRVNSPKIELDNLYWIPFFAGSIVEGNIECNPVTHIMYFNIKKYNIMEHNEESDEAYRFYKENYKEINSYLIKRRLK